MGNYVCIRINKYMYYNLVLGIRENFFMEVLNSLDNIKS